MLRRPFPSSASVLCVSLAFIAITGYTLPANGQDTPAAETTPSSSDTQTIIETKPAEVVAEKKEAPKDAEKPQDKAEVKPEEAPKDDDKKAEEKKPDDKKADEKKPEEQKPEDKKPEDKKADENKEADKKEADKAKEEKPKKPEPKKLPRIGRADGPLLPGQKWRVHDLRRPRPPVVTPGELSTYDKPGTPPSDAIVLFDGKDLSNWCHISPEDPSELLEAQWKVQDGYFEVTPGTNNLLTIDSFGSCQLHVEWQTPASPRGDSQGRGNSGIFLMDSFEVQVLDSFKNRTYADGQAGSMYGQYPPMVNASREPGQWQVYDILFEAPEFSVDGKLEKPAKLTLMHNGVFLHNGREYYGPTGGGVVPQYRALSPAAPIRLQNHGNPVRFRNIWIRPLPQMP